MITDPLAPEDPEEEAFLTALAQGFTGEITPDPFGVSLFEQDDDTDLWDTTDWWTGREKNEMVDITTNTRKEKAIAEDIYEKQTPGSSGSFQSADAATLADYENGRIPEKELRFVEGLGYYRRDAGKALKRMKRAAARDGISLSGGGYRSYEEQAALYEQKPDLAAPAGHSNHGLGIATDLSGVDFGSREYQWLLKNAKRFGWVHPDWAQSDGSKPEPWHWEYVGGEKLRDRFKRKKEEPKTVVRAERKLHNLAAHELDEPSAPLSAKGSFMNSILSMADDFDEEVVMARSRGEDPEPVLKAKILKQVPKQFRDDFAVAAKRSGLPIKLLVQMAAQETGGGDPGAIYMPKGANSAGAVGVVQVIPKWHPDFDANRLRTDARYNIIAGALILASYMDGLGLRKGLAAYNAGPSNWQAGLGYADEIIARMRGN